MNKRELKRLSRADLLEMLIVKTRENEQLRAELEQAKGLAAERPEAAPAAGADGQMNAVFQALKVAAEQYLENVRRLEAVPGAAEEEAK